ncbi:unnamed protein product [Acanthosepion pharaonis]|uniref:Uncharacterized protein n=1 Tax=Acanthosepion pharaonis TaxID=158019 RepID=A0A812CUS7_ACAPH|nr:unnamed protein product [Sepia pharaonis]
MKILSTVCLYLPILSLIPSNTTNIIHYLMPLLFSHPLPYLPILSLIPSHITKIIHYLMPLRFSHSLPYLPILSLIPSDTTNIIHYLMPALLSLFTSIFPFFPLSLPIQLILSITSCLCSSLTLYQYLPILSLLPSDTTNIIHYPMPLLFSPPLPVSSHSLPYPFQCN